MTDSRWTALRACVTRGDPPVLARDPDDRVHEPRDVLAARLERGADRVDEERPVVGVGLQHRAERLVAVVVERRVERAHARPARGRARSRTRTRRAPRRRGARARCRRWTAGGRRRPRTRARSRPPRSSTRSSRRSRYSVEPASVSSARLTTVNLAQPLLQRLELRRGSGCGSRSPKRARCACVWSSSARASSRSTLSASATASRSRPSSRQVLGLGHVADRRLVGLGLAVAAAEDPGQHARVLAEAGPQELAVVVLAEPVDVEDLRQLRAVALADLQPVLEVVGHVVAAERQHRERVEAQLADRAGRGRGLLGAPSSRRGTRRAPSRTPRARAARR